ncbi:hypothetical protein [Kitasatospora sp. NPDC004272]
MSRNRALGLLVGPILLLAGLLWASYHLVTHVRYAGASQVRATVLTAHYEQDGRGVHARRIVLAVPEAVPLDNLSSAPEGLRPGDTVTALTRPGHALLPGQLRWSLLLLPSCFVLVGLAGTATGVMHRRENPPPRPADPEAWD